MLFCLCAGIIWFGYRQQWIIIQMPASCMLLPYHKAQEQSITLHYWNDGAWHKETQSLLASDVPARMLQIILANWLTQMHDENIMRKKITLQSALIDSEHAIAYLSFDRSPLDKEWSIYEKWMCIEGILKTIAHAKLGIQSVYFLVKHHQLTDPHLDFSHAWPCSGYIKN